MGRPAIVKVEEVEKLCGMQCTQAEIAYFFGVSKQAIEKRKADQETLYPYTLDAGEKVDMTFGEIMDLGYSKGKLSQRREQSRCADAARRGTALRCTHSS